MKPMLRSLLLLLATVPLTAQDQASTLSLLSGAAEAVVTATVTGSEQSTPEFLRASFRVDTVLKGEPGPTFSMLEPAGACCGRALFALQPGQQVLLFLHHRGPAWHVLADGRGAVPARPAVVAHVRQLLGSADDGARAQLLFAALLAEDSRVRADAALALANMVPPAPDAGGQLGLATALRAELANGSALLPSLLQTAANTGQHQLVPELVLACLSTTWADRADLLAATLARMPAIAVTAAMADHWPDTTAGCLRAADLLAVLPLSHSAPLLQRLLHDGRSAKVTCRAATVLLEQGVPRSAFTDLLPPPLLDAAVRAAAAAPRLRLVRPRTRP